MDEIAHIGLVEDEALELDVSALQIAALDHPDTDLEPYVDLLGAFAERLIEVGGDASDAADRVAALASVFADEQRFEGDRDTYDDPANADMIRVIDRRRGLPVSLAILYVATARRIEWDAEILNTPGHVLIRIGAGAQGLVVDPFNRGSVLVGGGPGPRPVAMSNRAALVRLLANQATRADAAGDKARALAIYQRITTVAPAHAHGWWERARLEVAQGQVQAAAASLSAVLEVTRDPALRRNVAAALAALATRH